MPPTTAAYPRHNSCHTGGPRKSRSTRSVKTGAEQPIEELVVNCPRVQAHPELRQHVRPLVALGGAETAADEAIE
jgi:hypothetical protein